MQLKIMNEENSLWMGDIAPDIDESKIFQYFQNFNIFPTNVKLIKDKKTNTNKNYCFVFFKNIEDTNKALNQLNGKNIPNTNKTFKLNLASYHSPINRTIYVGNLNKSVTNETLLNFFQIRYNSVMKATVIKDNGVSKGFGFVVFKKENEYKKSLEEMDGILFEGKNIVVREQKKKEDDENSNNLNNILNYNNINSFIIGNRNDYQMTDNNFVNNSINNDLLINYNLRNNNINELALLNNMSNMNNEINNKLNINNLINNGIININNGILNQNNNIINLINFENKNNFNNLYRKENYNQNFINNKYIMNHPNINYRKNQNIDINKLLLLNNSINNNISYNLNKNFINKNDNINIYHNQNFINNKLNIKNDIINNISNLSKNQNKNKNIKKFPKLEILESSDQETLIKRIRDSINNTFYYYKKLNFSNGCNSNIRSK
jgi:RNA recognition motif-containing protein